MNTKQLLTTLIILVIGFAVGVTTLSVTAQTSGCVTPGSTWTGPSSAPTGGNICPPLNTGTDWQGRMGQLSIGTTTQTTPNTPGLEVIGGALIDAITTVNLGVTGTASTSNLVVTTGAGAGKVLTSDAQGRATWQTPTSSGGTQIHFLPSGSGGCPTDYGVICPDVFHTQGATGFVDWTTVNATTYGVPANAQAVIVFASGSLNGPDGHNWNAYIAIRSSAAAHDSRPLIFGQSSGGEDGTTASGQGMFPLDNGTFQYQIGTISSDETLENDHGNNTGFNKGAFMKIIGWVGPAN